MMIKILYSFKGREGNERRTEAKKIWNQIKFKVIMMTIIMIILIIIIRIMMIIIKIMIIII